MKSLPVSTIFLITGLLVSLLGETGGALMP